MIWTDHKLSLGSQVEVQALVPKELERAAYRDVLSVTSSQATEE